MFDFEMKNLDKKELFRMMLEDCYDTADGLKFDLDMYIDFCTNEDGVNAKDYHSQLVYDISKIRKLVETMISIMDEEDE